MSNITPNQPIRFQTQAEIDAGIACGGQPFAQKVISTDSILFQVLNGGTAQIIDSNNTVVKTATKLGPFSGLYLFSASWASLSDGCYRIKVDVSGTNYYSNYFDLKSSHSNTLKLRWTNSSNAFGLDYESVSWTFQVRLEAKLRNPFYEKEEKEIFIYSNGTREVLRSRTVKTQMLVVAEIPEYLHDAVSIGIEHDTFTIDGVEYINEEVEYSPVWRKSSLLAPVEIEVRKKEQNLINGAC